MFQPKREMNPALGSQEKRKFDENIRLSEINRDNHVIHFGLDEEIGVGDKDASLSIKELVDAACNLLPENKSIVLGNHPIDYSRTEFDLDNPNAKKLLELLEKPETANQAHELYLKLQKAVIDKYNLQLREKVSEGGKTPPEILFGVEADVAISSGGEVCTIPPKEILSKADLDVVTFSFHGERIKQPLPENLAKALEYVLSLESEGNLIAHRIGHPFVELRKIYDWDRVKFKELIDLAKDNLVAFELNVDKGFDEEILKELVNNENFLDFGTDHHAFRHILKESAISSEIELTQNERELTEYINKDTKFRRREKSLWHGTSIKPGVLKMIEGLETSKQEELKERLWKLYKHTGKLEGLEGRELEEAFVQEREELTKRIAKQEEITQIWLGNELTFLFQTFPGPYPKYWEDLSKTDLTEYKKAVKEVEKKIAKSPLGYSDMKALFGKFHQAKTRVGIPKSLFVSAWSREKQNAFLKKDKASMELLGE